MNMFKSLALVSSVMLISGCNALGTIPLDKHRSLSNTSWGYQVVKDPTGTAPSETVERFEVRPGDCGSDPGWSDCANDRERSEISTGFTQSTKILPGQDRWIGFYIYLPEDFETSWDVRTTLGQIHMKGGMQGTAGGFKSFPPLIQLEAKNGWQGDGYITSYHRLTGDPKNISDVAQHELLSKLDDMKGKWTHVMFHIAGKGPSPYLEIFINGDRKAEFVQTLPKAPEHYYFKYGIYRSFVSRHGGPMPIQIVFYDEVKMGTSREEVESIK